METLLPGLYLVATPLGNLGDFSTRAHDTLSSVDVIVCEDTREMKKLLTLVGIERGERDIISLHEHNEHERARSIVELIEAGSSVAYASDAGMPAISDPGAILVDCAHDSDVLVTSVPGATAVTTAVAVSGFAHTAFSFVGFFPRDQNARSEFVTMVSQSLALVVFYESPKRLRATLKFLAENISTQQRGVVCRELTKKFEEIRRGSFSELAQHFDGEVKGECVVVVEGNVHAKTEGLESADEHSLTELAHKLFEAGMSSKDAVELMFSTTGCSKNVLKSIFQNVKNADKSRANP